ncbi:hypothetical protein OY671_012392, partial [Metschnikowia pulcherrima]
RGVVRHARRPGAGRCAGPRPRAPDQYQPLYPGQPGQGRRRGKSVHAVDARHGHRTVLGRRQRHAADHQQHVPARHGPADRRYDPGRRAAADQLCLPRQTQCDGGRRQRHPGRHHARSGKHQSRAAAGAVGRRRTVDAGQRLDLRRGRPCGV